MSKYIEQIPLGSIKRMAIVLGNGRLAAKVKKDTGANIVINFGFFSGKKPTHHLKIDGSVFAKEDWGCWGYAWDTGPDIKMEILPAPAHRNYIAGLELISPMTKEIGLQYDRKGELGGIRGRTALALKPGHVITYCSNDSKDASTLEGVQGELLALGAESAVYGDGGGSSQGVGDGWEVKSSDNRAVYSYLCIWLNDENEEDKPVDGITKMYTTLNPCYINQVKRNKKDLMLHSTGTPGATVKDMFAAWNKASAAAAVEFCIDDTGSYQFLPLGIKSGHCAASGNDTHVACEICEPEETIFLPINWRPLSKGGLYNRPYAVTRLQQELLALGFDPKGVDGSFGPGCEAAVVAYQKSVGIATDGSVGPTTLRYLQKREGSHLRYKAALADEYFKKVYGYAVELFAWLCGEIGLEPGKIVCHSEGFKLGIASNHSDVLHWFPQHGKSMDTFRADVAAVIAGNTQPTDPLGDAVNKLAAAGILTAQDYWKGGNYSAANVQALLIKMAATI